MLGWKNSCWNPPFWDRTLTFPPSQGPFSRSMCVGSSLTRLVATMSTEGCFTTPYHHRAGTCMSFSLTYNDSLYFTSSPVAVVVKCVHRLKNNGPIENNIFAILLFTFTNGTRGIASISTQPLRDFFVFLLLQYSDVLLLCQYIFFACFLRRKNPLAKGEKKCLKRTFCLQIAEYFVILIFSSRFSLWRGTKSLILAFSKQV